MSDETASGAPLVEIGQGFGQAIEVVARPAPLPAQGPPGGGTMSADVVRAEHRRIVTDKTHPMHEAFQRGDPKVQEHINKLYRDAFGAAPVELGQGITVTGRPGATGPPAPAPAADLSPEDGAANAAATDELRKEWGDEFSTKYEAARAEMLTLQETHGEDALDDMLGRALAAGFTRASILKFLASEHAARER